MLEKFAPKHNLCKTRQRKKNVKKLTSGSIRDDTGTGGGCVVGGNGGDGIGGFLCRKLDGCVTKCNGFGGNTILLFGLRFDDGGLSGGNVDTPCIPSGRAPLKPITLISGFSPGAATGSNSSDDVSNTICNGCWDTDVENDESFDGELRDESVLLLPC